MEEALSLLSLCKEGSPERVREFLLANANLDERDNRGRTGQF